MVIKASLPVPLRLKEDLEKNDGRGLRLVLQNMKEIIEELRGLVSGTGTIGTTSSGGGGGISSNAGTLDGEDGTFYLNRANHTGTQSASTISDFASAAVAATEANAIAYAIALG